MTPTTPTESRWFYRCGDCLTVFAADSAKAHDGLLCACGGRSKVLGKVRRGRLVIDALACPCDGRCTGARGPSCDCSCGGKNHGSGMVVRVTVFDGAIPKASSAPNAKALAQAEAFRAALAPLRAERDELHASRRNGYLPPQDYTRMLDLEQGIAHAKRLKSHAPRMKVLAAYARKA